MALKLGELVTILKSDNRPLEKGLADGRRKARDTGRAMEGDAATAAAGIARQWGAGGARSGDAFVREAGGKLRDSKGRFVADADEAGRAAGEAFTRGADARLRDSRGRFVGVGSALGDGVSQGMGNGLRSSTGMLSGLTSVLGSIGGPLGTAVMGITAIGSAAAFAAPLIGVLGGALGSLPGIIGGLGVLTGALGLGFMGLGDAFKKTAGGSAGGAMVDTAYQIAQAERRLRDANEEVTASQENLTRARKRAKEAADDLRKAEERAAENLQDLARDVEGAKIAEERAAMRVTEAQDEYNAALAKGDPKAIAEASLALREAKHSAEEAKDRVEDLGKEQEDAAKKGIKGSDEVKAAQERHQAAIDEVEAARKRERAAVEGVADAEHALAQARKSGGGGGGGGGAGAEITKLAPAAQAAVDAIKSLKPAFESLRLEVQERLFKGVGDRIRDVAEAWLPTLRERLGGMATTLNGLFHNLGASVTKPQFISDMNVGMEAFERLVGKVGKALTGPFVDAWGRLARASEPFIDALGDGLAGVIEKFAAWIKSADESGKLEDFFHTAAGFFKQVGSIGQTVVGIIGEIISIIWGSAKEKNPLESFQGALEKVREWLADPENAGKIQDFFTKLTEYSGDFLGLLEKIGPAAGVAFDLAKLAIDPLIVTVGLLSDAVEWVGGAIDWVGKNAPKWWQKVKDATGSAKDWVVKKWNQMLDWFDKLPGKISKKASGMWNGIKDAFRSAINWVIGKWNNLSFGIAGGSFMGMSWGPMSMGTPDIPYLAQGGVVPATPGGRLAVIGEGGEDEAVMPLSKLQQMFGRMVLELRSSGSAVDDFLVEILRDAIRWRGGDVQVVLGQ